MRSPRTRAAAAVLSCLAGGAVAVGPVGTAAASGHHTSSKARSAATAHKVKHQHGFFVVGRNGTSQRVENFGTESALVRDGDGREHVVTTQRTKADPTKGHLVYLTRETDAAKWIARTTPGTFSLNGGMQVEAHLSNNGLRVAAVLFGCDGIYAADAMVSAHRLPVPTRVKALDECTDPPAHSDNPPTARVATFSDRTIYILIEDEVASNPVWSIYSGQPTTAFTATSPLPTADGFTPVQIAADPLVGRIAVVGTGSDGTNQGIYETNSYDLGESWSDPVLVATLDSPTTDYKIDAFQAYNRNTYVGLEKPSTGQHVAHSLFLARGLPSGQWNGTLPLAHATGDDRDLRLAINTSTGNPHAVWTRMTGKAKTSGLLQEARGRNGWGKPIYLTHSARDVATQITLNVNNYHPTVGYNR